MELKINQTLLLIAIVLFGCNQKTPVKNIEVAGVNNPEILLNGTWKFTMNPPEKFWENNIDFQSWPDIQL